MSLRLRLVLALVAVSVPLVAGLTWVRGLLDYRAQVESLHRFLVGRMVDGRAVCEADPQRWPPLPWRPGEGDRGPGPRRDGPPGDPRKGPRDGPRDRPPGERAGAPVELFAYDPEFASANPRAPEFPAALRAALESGELRADERFADRGHYGIRVSARMPWGEGPCAIVLASRPVEEPRWLTTNQLWTAGGLSLGLTLAVFLAAGPLVGRVRRLTGEVRRSASSRYAVPVTVTGNDELSDLAREFNEAREEVNRQFSAVEDREEALRRFVANTMHDVMIPMTVLQGHLTALRDGSGAPDPDVLCDAMVEVQYMTSLLQNLGASAKLEASEASLDTGDVDLGALVERVVGRHAPIARAKGGELEYGLPEERLVVRGDLTLLEQAVGNLVHNAVRYGHEGGHVAVLVERPSAGGWRLRVVDDGPGIPDELRARLLERDARGDEARSRHPEGQGLGLHIALEVARRHGFVLELRRSEYGGLEAEIRGAAGDSRPPSSS